ncbi:putative annexin [Schistosoma mansoni]|uniref:putative annexin n=1 Tax=Schistosoma mansoni TaxID=6183 RepID=UPI00022DC247|nr:putative annexin [Schistosoma mansoni]|eukprot:XP_018652853.1 putative annexin [Schistosoma mansoni]
MLVSFLLLIVSSLFIQIIMGRDKSQLVGPNDETYDPTLKFEVHNDPEKDAEKLYEVVKGTDEHRIIKVLGHRNAYQRIEIRDTFKALYGKDLVDELSRGTSGHFRKLLKMLLTNLYEVDASALYKAMKGAGTDEETIIEVLCTATNEEIENIKQAYLCADILNDISRAFPLHFVYRNMLTSFQIVSRRNRMIFQRMNYSHPFIVVHVNCSFTSLIFLLNIVNTCLNRPKAYSDLLVKAMKGIGTDDCTLMRIIVTRCEVSIRV